MASPWTFLTPHEATQVKPGIILFLPHSRDIPAGVYRDGKLEAGAYNHPVVVLSLGFDGGRKEGKGEGEWRISDRVRVLIIRSFRNTSLTNHLSTHPFPPLPFHSTLESTHGFHRLAPSTNPLLPHTIPLIGNRGMKRQYSYVDVKAIFVVELGALAFYGERKRGVEGWVVGSGGVATLEEEVRAWRERGWGVVDGGEEEEREDGEGGVVERRIERLVREGLKRKRWGEGEMEVVRNERLDGDETADSSRERKNSTKFSLKNTIEEKAEVVDSQTAKRLVTDTTRSRKRVLGPPKPMFGGGKNSMKKFIGL